MSETMSPSNNTNSERSYFRRQFGKRDSAETLKERARAGRLKSSGSSIGKSPVKVLSPEPLAQNTSSASVAKTSDNAELLVNPTFHNNSSTAIMVKESSSEEYEEGQAQAVRVAVRLRPLNPLEVLASKRTLPLMSSPSKTDDAYDSFKAWNIEKVDGKDVLVQKGSGRKIEGKNMFTFDGVFQEDHSTSYVYDNFAKPIVKAVLTGKHGTIFTYGTSGSGKTHSMQGDGKDGSLHKDGIIQLAVRDLFNHIKKDAGKRQYVMRISFFEIYNEQVRDLLSTSGNHHRSPSKTCRASPSVHQGASRFTFDSPPPNQHTNALGADSEKKQVSSVDDVLKLLYAGNQNRAVATTILNDASSRSHAIFRLTIESRERTSAQRRHNLPSDSNHIVRVSALNFVDLAGSENTAKAATVGSRRRESGKINQSLLSLSQVIHALSLPPRKRPKFINYRNSKLTRILQPHLSGNAVLAVLCCATPARANFEETRGTLKFGASAKRIQMKPIVNEIVDDKALIKKLRKELKEAQDAIKMLAAERRQGRVPNEHMKSEQKAARDSTAASPIPKVGSSSPTGSPSPTSSGRASGTSNSTMATPEDSGRERRMDRSERGVSTPRNGRVEPSPLASPSVTPERVSSPNNMTNNTPYDIADLNAVLLDNRLRSADEDSKAEMSIQQDGNSTLSDLSSRRPSIRVVQDSPPSEVTIIRSPLSDIGDDVDINVRLNDAEERAKFLEEKLEAADRLVELMTRDLRNARLCIHELVFRNVRLENQLASNSGATVPSTVDMSEGHRSDKEHGETMMPSERIGI